MGGGRVGVTNSVNGPRRDPCVLPEPQLPNRAAIPAFPSIAFVGENKVQNNCYRHKRHNHTNIITLMNLSP